MKFVTLRIGMKNKMLRFSSLLLVIWYCFSVIGFGVHTCRASNRSFVTTFVSGFSCEEIHPGHDCSCHRSHEGCHECHSCADHATAADSVQTAPCCEDDYHSLLITGSVSADMRDISSECSFCTLPVQHDVPASVHYVRSLEFGYDTGLIVRRGLRPLLNIWRI